MSKQYSTDADSIDHLLVLSNPDSSR